VSIFLAEFFDNFNFVSLVAPTLAALAQTRHLAYAKDNLPPGPSIESQLLFKC